MLWILSGIAAFYHFSLVYTAKQATSELQTPVCHLQSLSEEATCHSVPKQRLHQLRSRYPSLCREHNVQTYSATTELRRFYHSCETTLARHSRLPKPNSSVLLALLHRRPGQCKTAPSMQILLLVIQPFHWLWEHGTSQSGKLS